MSESFPTGIRAAAALLPDGWATDVSIYWDHSGRITRCETDSSAKDLPFARGPVVPGMVNLHSHAFQRALVGRTQRFDSAADDFWSWRAAMYASLPELDPKRMEAIAMEVYGGMLRAGYTSVCEFHYVHNAPNGAAYANPDALSDALIAAAERTGIGLTLLPVYYAHGGFGGRRPEESQRRFILGLENYLAMVDRLRLRGVHGCDLALGYAPHSLRAVDPDALAAILAHRAAHAPAAPMHIHVAEQEREVADCLAHLGKRPVDWILSNAAVDPAWCFIHATHADRNELRGIAESGAVVGLCPTTEGDLGDGIFDLPAYVGFGGGFGIGSDSNASVSPFEELRLLEYVQRLRTRRRNIDGEVHPLAVGTKRYLQALKGGERASGRRVGRLETGYRADCVVLEAGHDMMRGKSPDEQLNAAVFSGDANSISTVISGGRVAGL